MHGVLIAAAIGAILAYLDRSPARSDLSDATPDRENGKPPDSAPTGAGRANGLDEEARLRRQNDRLKARIRRLSERLATVQNEQSAKAGANAPDNPVPIKPEDAS